MTDSAIDKYKDYKQRLEDLDKRIIELGAERAAIARENERLLAELKESFNIESRDQLKDKIQEMVREIQQLNQNADEILAPLGVLENPSPEGS